MSSCRATNANGWQHCVEGPLRYATKEEADHAAEGLVCVDWRGDPVGAPVVVEVATTAPRYD